MGKSDACTAKVALSSESSATVAVSLPGVEETVRITRAEFEAALDQLAEQGVALKADRDQAWMDLVGWRVNYDAPLLALAALSLAPKAMWSSDRAHMLPSKKSKTRLFL